MYPAIKSDAINEDEARKLVGDEAVDKVLAENCDFTGRVIDDVYEVVEMSASVNFIDDNGDDRVLTVLYLINSNEQLNEMDTFDYSDYTFTIN